MGGTLGIWKNFTVEKKNCIFFLSLLYTYDIQILSLVMLVYIEIFIICMTTTHVYIHGWSKGGNEKFQKSKKIKKIKVYNKNK